MIVKKGFLPPTFTQHDTSSSFSLFGVSPTLVLNGWAICFLTLPVRHLEQGVKASEYAQASRHDFELELLVLCFVDLLFVW